MFGDPVTDAVWWRNANPPHLARNLAGTTVWFAVGNGRPCDAKDLGGAAELAPFTLLDSYVSPQAKALHAALSAARVAHTYDPYGCGMHTYRYAQRDIHAFWPVMHAAFGSRAPRRFDYRRADPRFSVWGWRFRADPARAAEFLDITNASRRGITLTGSGTESVRTARYFSPRERVRLRGAVERRVRADRRGRISFHVDLGRPHPHQQYTLDALLAGQHGPGYFTTRRVGFSSRRRK